MIDLLRTLNLNKNFDGVTALKDLSFSPEEKDIFGLIGPNGAGKTTFFNVLSGFIKPEFGRMEFEGIDITNSDSHKIVSKGISRTFQDLRLIRQIPVIDNILLSFNHNQGENIYNILFKQNSWKQIEEQDKKRALELLEYAGIKEKAYNLANDLSYGQQKLLSIICCLAADAKLLLLDEPIAGLNPEMRIKILNIISELPSKGKSAIIIEHDMDFVSDVCNRVIFMDMGEKISEGSPGEVKNDPKVIEAYLE